MKPPKGTPEHMLHACADVIIDRLTKLRAGNYSGLSKQEVGAQVSLCEMLLARFGFPYGCEFRIQQESDKTMVHYEMPIDYWV